MRDARGHLVDRKRMAMRGEVARWRDVEAEYQTDSYSTLPDLTPRLSCAFYTKSFSYICFVACVITQ
ncbi:hypothetical protein JOQ06_000343, partial [Pogonophryne albipinna]